MSILCILLYKYIFKYVYDNSHWVHPFHILLPQLRSHFWIILSIYAQNVKYSHNLALVWLLSLIILISSIHYFANIWITTLRWIVHPWLKSLLFGIINNPLRRLAFHNLKNGRDLSISLEHPIILWITDIHYHNKAKLKYFFQLMMIL